METHVGRLFDLGPDGLGYIAEGTRIWAFRYPKCGGALAPDMKAFRRLEGQEVEFSVNAGSIQSIERHSQTHHKAATAVSAR